MYICIYIHKHTHIYIDVTTDIPTLNSIRPLMLKSLVGGTHPEFKTNKQQDALEYFQYFLEFLSRKNYMYNSSNNNNSNSNNNNNSMSDVSNIFKFELEDRMQCSSSGMYVCMYVCIYIFTYVCMCVCIYLYMYISMHLFIYVCMFMHICNHKLSQLSLSGIVCIVFPFTNYTIGAMCFLSFCIRL